MNLFDKIADETNLLKAWIKVRYYANTSMPYFDRLAYDVFEDGLNEHLRVLQFELKQGLFKFSPLRYFVIPKQNGTRKMYFGTPKDEIAAQAIVNVIGPIFEATFLDASFGNRLNTDRTESKAIFKNWLDQYERYIRKVRAIVRHPDHCWYQVSDFSNFYPSINKNTLRSDIANLVADSRVLELIEQLLDLDAITLGGGREPIPGLPPGPAYSHFLANIHLDGFDKFMVANTIEYYRYVDDFCYLVGAQPDVQKVNALIASFFAGRSEPGVVLNEEKTDSRSLIEPEVLIGHTAKMKYDLRFDALRSIVSIADHSESVLRQSEAEKLFRGLFTKVEGDEDAAEVVRKSAAFIASRLNELVMSKDEALNIAYGLLELKPNRISALRVVINAVMELSLNSEDRMARFVIYLESSEALYQAVFLQLINAYRPIPERLLVYIRQKMVTNSNELLRAMAYYVLANSEGAIEPKQFRSWVQSENSGFAMKYLVGCIRNLGIEGSDRIWIEIGPLRQSQDSSVLAVIGYSLRHALDKHSVASELVEILYAPPLEWAFQNVEVGIPSLRLLFTYGHSLLIEHAYDAFVSNSTRELGEIADVLVSTIALATVNVLLAGDKTGQLIQLIDTLHRVGLSNVAITGYQEIVSKTDDKALEFEARRLWASIREELIPPGLPTWYRLDTCDLGIYFSLFDGPEYQCRVYDCQVEHKRGTLEIISQKRVTANGAFGACDEWLGYLKDLSNKGHICLRETGLLQDGSVFAIYERPDGYLPLSEMIADSQFAKTESVVLGMISLIVEAVQKTRNSDGFYFYNVSPCNVLWNPSTREVKFLNIGSGLGVPKYLCGEKICGSGIHQTEIGVGTDCYLVGLLATQLLAQACPVQFHENIYRRSRQGNSRNGSIKSVERLELLPHTRSILGRAIQSKPDFRYSELAVINDDFQEVIGFLSQTSTPSDNLILVDYLSFRLRVATRNPRVMGAPVSRKLREIVWNLSKDLSYYDVEDLRELADRMGRTRFRNELPGWRTWKWQGVESKNLMLLARAWQSLVKDASEEAGRSYPSTIADIIAVWSLYIELLSVLAAILSSNRGAPDVAAQCETFVNTLLGLTDELNTASIRYTLGSQAETFRNPFQDTHIQDALQIVTSGLKTVYSGLAWEGESITGMAAVLCLFCLECEVIDQSGHTIAKATGPLHLGSAPRNISQFWMLVRPMIETEQLLRSILAIDSMTEDVSSQQNWNRVINQLMEYVRELSPAVRVPATLTKFSPLSSPRDGIIRLGLPPSLVRYVPVRHTIPPLTRYVRFTEAESLIVGDLIPRLESRVDVDLVSDREDKAPSSVLGDVDLFRDVAKLKPSRKRRLGKFISKHHRSLAVILAVLVLIPLTFVTQYAIPLQLERNPTMIGVLAVLGTILSVLLSLGLGIVGNVLTPDARN